MTAHTRHDPVAPVDPGALSPVLRVLRACMHALVAVLVVVLVVRATAAPDGVGRHGSFVAGPTAVSLGALAFSVVYATGAWLPRVRHSVRAAGVWLSVLLACWVVLVLLTPDAVWLAFPLFFLELHLRRSPWRPPGASSVAELRSARSVAVGAHDAPAVRGG